MVDPHDSLSSWDCRVFGPRRPSGPSDSGPLPGSPADILHASFLSAYYHIVPIL